MTRRQLAVITGLTVLAWLAVAAVVGAVVFGARAAFGHSWYEAACCSSQDCKPVHVTEISEDGPDYVWQGMRFPKASSRPSMDENYHVCARPAAPFIQPRIICIYRPSPGV